MADVGRAGEAERMVEAARRSLSSVAESMTEHAYQELASTLESPPRIADKTVGFDPPGREWTAGDALGLRRDTVKETIIEGWRCYVADDNIRHVERDFGFTLRTVHLDKHGGLAGDYCYVPPAVLDWLIRPMLSKAWEAGVVFSHANPAALSDKLADNPHKDT